LRSSSSPAFAWRCCCVSRSPASTSGPPGAEGLPQRQTGSRLPPRPTASRAPAARRGPVPAA
jgi:hypothetical protein